MSFVMINSTVHVHFDMCVIQPSCYSFIQKKINERYSVTLRYFVFIFAQSCIKTGQKYVTYNVSCPRILVARARVQFNYIGVHILFWKRNVNCDIIMSLYFFLPKRKNRYDKCEKSTRYLAGYIIVAKKNTEKKYRMYDKVVSLSLHVIAYRHESRKYEMAYIGHHILMIVLILKL